MDADGQGSYSRYAGSDGSYPQITLITKHGSNAHMSKRIFIDESGVLRSDGSQCQMVKGIAARAPAATAEELAGVIANCRSDQAIALGALGSDIVETVTVTVPSRLKDHPTAITRSRKYIDYRLGTPAWCLIDYDTKGMPDHISVAIEAAGGMWQALMGAASGLARAARAPAPAPQQVYSVAIRGANRCLARTACIITSSSWMAAMRTDS